MRRHSGVWRVVTPHLTDISVLDVSQALQPMLLAPAVLQEKEVLDVSLSSTIRSWQHCRLQCLNEMLPKELCKLQHSCASHTELHALRIVIEWSDQRT